MVQIGSAAGVIAVQTLWRTILSSGAETWSKALAQCRGAIGPKVEVVTVQDLTCEQCANPGLTPLLYFTLMQEQIAKNVTSLLTLPSVLALVIFKKSWSEL
jgi:hypothetical protein